MRYIVTHNLYTYIGIDTIQVAENKVKFFIKRDIKAKIRKTFPVYFCYRFDL